MITTDRDLRLRYWVDLLASVCLATATIGTAWSAYQSSLWNNKYGSSKSQMTTATIRVGKFTNLAMQKTAVHVNLFGEWAAAVHRRDTRLADFLFVRFPEPLRAATTAWQAAHPEAKDLDIPGTPFDLPEYMLPETREAERWEAVAASESDAAEQAIAIANRYLLFTIIFSSVLFFAGISGKCGRKALDVGLLALGALVLLTGMAIMLTSPRI